MGRIVPIKSKLKKPELREVAVAEIYDRYSSYPSNGLTPERLANIFREADSGNILRQSELFEEMEEKDPHLYAQLQTRKNAVTGLDFEVIAFDGEDERDKEIAEFVSRELASIESIEEVMMDLLDAIGKGIAVSEIIWRYQDGGITVQEILPRHQKKFLWDEQNQFKVITQEAPMGVGLPENKFIIHRYKARSGHPSRGGVLRVVAWMYLFKNFGVKDWISFCEVFGMPLRLGKYNPSASEEDKRSLEEALIRIGADAAGIIPDGTEIEFKEAGKSSSVDVYERLARYCDEQISKAVLGQTLTADSGGGSFAQSKTHNEVRHDLTVADCKALAATLRRDLIRPLVLFNFGEDRRIPYIRFDCEEAQDLKESVEIYKGLWAMGLKIPTAHLYKKFSIPQPEDGEEVATTAVTPSIPNMTALELKGKAPRQKDPQASVDRLVDLATEKSAQGFEKLFIPLKKVLATVESLEDAVALCSDEESLTNLMDRMDAGELEMLLQKAMFASHLQGRVLEHE